MGVGDAMRFYDAIYAAVAALLRNVDYWPIKPYIETLAVSTHSKNMTINYAIPSLKVLHLVIF